MKGSLGLFTTAGAVLFTCSALAAIDCSVVPDCGDLGYTDTAAKCDSSGMLKCPFDQTKVFCRNYKSASCSVGSVLYSDLKCYDSAPGNLTAVGVVFDVTNKLAVALDYKSSIKWGTSTGDISSLDNCTTSNYASCGTDGRSNTANIVAHFGAGTGYAAGYCNAKTDGLSAGSWFLPSASQLKTLYTNKARVNTGLSAAGGTTIASGYYWSSTEYSSNVALAVDMYNGDVPSLYKTNYINHARCVVAF